MKSVNTSRTRTDTSTASREQWAAFRLRARISATTSKVSRRPYANGLSNWRTRCNNNRSASSQARHTHNQLQRPRPRANRHGRRGDRNRRHQTRPTLVSPSSLPYAAALRLTSQRAQLQLPHRELALDSSEPTASGVDPHRDRVTPNHSRHATTMALLDAGVTNLRVVRADVSSLTKRWHRTRTSSLTTTTRKSGWPP